MTIHQCPKCELRFDWKTELDDHCRQDHPEFRHEYPAAVIESEPVEPPLPPPATSEVRHTHIDAASFGAWLQPPRPREHHGHHPEGDRQPPPH